MSSRHRVRRRLLEEITARDLGGGRDRAVRALSRRDEWEDTYEVAMGAYATDSIKRIPGGFRGEATRQSGWRTSIDLATFDDAWDAMRLLQTLGQALAHALTWAREPSPSDFEIDRDRGPAERYLRHLAKETAGNQPILEELARGDWHADGPHERSVVELPPPTDWNFVPEHLYVVTVHRDSLALESDCTSLTRARQYLGVFDAVAADLVDILGWNPLPAETQPGGGQVDAPDRQEIGITLLALGALSLASLARRARRS